MSKDPGPVIDQRLVRAVAHPKRIAILEALIGEEVLSFSQISEKLAIKPASVDYHVGVLTASGAIEAVPMGPHQGDTEQTLRLTPLSLIGNQRWRELSPSMRDEISTVLLQGFMDQAGSYLLDYEGRGA